MEAPKRRNDEQKAGTRQFAPSLLHRFPSVKGGPKAAALAFLYCHCLFSLSPAATTISATHHISLGQLF